MAGPNTLIFVDMPSDDPAATARFYGEVLGWEIDPRSGGLFHRMIPGGFFPNKDGADSEIGNLHIGISNAASLHGPAGSVIVSPSTGTLAATSCKPLTMSRSHATATTARGRRSRMTRRASCPRVATNTGTP